MFKAIIRDIVIISAILAIFVVAMLGAMPDPPGQSVLISTLNFISRVK